MTIDAANRARLLALARQSITAGRGKPGPATPPVLLELPVSLREPGASFVTLRVSGVLRGCRGALDAERPLAHDVWHNAWASAYDDPRFPSLETGATGSVEIAVSVLSALEPVAAASLAELLDQLEAGCHGLVLAVGPRRATFLPQVWATLPEPSRFVSELLAKAGAPTEPWSPLTQAWRYTTQTFGSSA